MPRKIQTTQLFQHFGSVRILDCTHAAMLMRRLHSLLDSLLHSEVLCGHLRRGHDCLHPDDWLHDNLRERPRNDQPRWKPRVPDDSRGVKVLWPQCAIPAHCSCSEMPCLGISFLSPVLQESLGILLMLHFTWLLSMLRTLEHEEQKHNTSCR